MGPRKAAEIFKARYPDAASYRVTLFGSLAATGRGHQTDTAIESALAPAKTDILWKPDETRRVGRRTIYLWRIPLPPALAPLPPPATPLPPFQTPAAREAIPKEAPAAVPY